MGTLSASNLSDVYKRFVFTASGSNDGSTPMKIASTSETDGNSLIANLSIAQLHTFSTNALCVTLHDSPSLLLEVAGDLKVTGNSIFNSADQEMIKFSGDNIEIPDDLELKANLSKIFFGASGEVKLSHLTNNGIILELFSLEADPAVTKTLLNLEHTANATVGVGIATNIDYSFECTGGTRLMASLQTVTTRIVNTEETADFLIKLIDDGAYAEKLRLTSTGKLRLSGNVIQASDGADTITIDPSNDLVTFLGDIKLGGDEIYATSGVPVMTITGNDVSFQDNIILGSNYGELVSFDGNANIQLGSLGPRYYIQLDADEIWVEGKIKWGSGDYTILQGGGVGEGVANGLGLTTHFSADAAINYYFNYIAYPYGNWAVGGGLGRSFRMQMFPDQAYLYVCYEEIVVTSVAENLESVDWVLKLLPAASDTPVERFRVSSEGLITCPLGLDVPDTGFIKLGDDDDFTIYHDGSNSYLNHSGVGDLNIATSNTQTVTIGDGSGVIHANGDLTVEEVFKAEDGVLRFKERAVPFTTADGYGKLYTTVDDKLHFADGASAHSVILLELPGTQGVILESGRLALKETTTPTPVATYGRIYTKNDNKLYFQSGDGVEHEIEYA